MISKDIFKLPNILTILRIIFTPIFFYFLMKGNIEVGLIIFMFVAVTDLADGWVARSTNSKTKMGELIDPIADKIMIFFAILLLVLRYGVPIWILPLFIFRDIITTFGSIFSLIKKKGKVQASVFGKYTTFFQVSTFLVYIINLGFKEIILYFTIILSLLSGCTYIYSGYKLNKKPKKI